MRGFPSYKYNEYPKCKQYFPLYFVEDNRIYGYVRLETGDEMSKRAKFALITWIGPSVSALKKAKVSTDKAFLKEACPVRQITQTRSLHAHICRFCFILK